MKKNLLLLATLTLIFCLNFRLALSANEQFRSVTSGNWNSNSTWEMSTNNGSTWFAATSTPRDTSGAITIQSPNTVTVTVSVNADQLTVNGGGTLSINNTIVLSIFDGSGDDLTLLSSATLSGAGTVQTQATGITLKIAGGSNFTAALKVSTGVTTAFDVGFPFFAVFKGAVTVDANATLNVAAGGYGIQVNGTLTNNGEITANGSTFTVRGALINNDTIKTTILNFDSTTTLSGTGAYTSNSIIIGSSGNVSLANNVTFSPATQLVINGGGVLNPNTRIFTFNSGTFLTNNGSTVSNSGTFQTQGTVSHVIRFGSNFNAPLKVNTGTTTSYDDGTFFRADYKGTITVDAGATLRAQSGGYFVRALGTVTNNGTISAPGSSTFIIKGPTLTNTGIINPDNLTFDTTTTASGAGSYSATNMTITGSANLSLSGAITLSPVSNLTINSGGKLTPSGEQFTFTSGSFILNTGAIVSGSGISAGTMRTQGTVTFLFRNGSTFNSAVNVNTGTLTAYNDQSPFNAIYNGSIFVNTGATFTTLSGGFSSQANNTVTNNGTISGPGSSTFRMKGATLTNNNIINPQILIFDSTTSLAGTGSYSASAVTISSSGNVSLAANVTFSPSTFTINSGGILNPNTKVFNFNSGTFFSNNGSTVTNSGTFQTQSSVNLVIRTGSNFNAPLKVNTGVTNSYDDGNPFTAIYKGIMTIDAGATLQVQSGGYFIQANNTVTNNGTISGSGSTFRMRGASLANNNSINVTGFSFDSTTSLSGTGTYTSSTITIASSGNVSLANNVTFSPTSSCTINSGGTLNPNTKVFTFNSGTFNSISGSTISNSGTFQTQGTVSLNIKNGSSFNAPLKVNTGTATSYDDGGIFTAVYNGTITVDAGAIFSVLGGGYFVRANNDVTNNGTISATSTFRMFGTTLTNNGNVTGSTFNFETGAHTLQGTGSWATTANILSGSTVTLASNHQMQSVNINSGGTFNLSTFKLSLTNPNPVTNNGTFTTASSTIEYNGTSAQSISTTNVSYNKLRINNSAGTTLLGATTIADTLSVILGDLDLSGFILTISPTGYLTETAGNTVKGNSGYITTTRNLNAPSALNVGGLGAVITTGVNLGSTEIRRGHTIQNGLNGGQSIERYFDILPTTNTGLNATLVFKYDDSELNGRSETFLSLYRSTNSGSTWTAQGGTPNAGANTITLSSIGAFSRWSANSSVVAAQIKALMEGFYNNVANRLNMRDTMRIYFRNISSPYAVVDSAKSVIDSNTFTGNFFFNNAATGTYYLQLKHRNSLETWSKSGGVSYTMGTTLSYDFTTAAAQAYGSNMVQKGSKFCVYSGDVDQEGNIDVTDLLTVYNDVNNIASGYVRTDVNGDSIVDVTDLLITYNNVNLGISKITP